MSFRATTAAAILAASLVPVPMTKRMRNTGSRPVSALAAREAVNPAVLKYLNRLSDHLFVLARWVNDRGAGDVLWVPGANR